MKEGLMISKKITHCEECKKQISPREEFYRIKKHMENEELDFCINCLETF